MKNFSSAEELKRSWDEATYSLKEILHSVSVLHFDGSVETFAWNSSSTPIKTGGYIRTIRVWIKFQDSIFFVVEACH